mmetsp:Transcript_17188/g.22321  ORF Transcript_17188/g.22321 Transcript_17188/m.22321 type:complete len:549 (+) Transcript_17188:48-1694(+)
MKAKEPKIDQDLLNRATGALLKNHESKTAESKNLLGDEEGMVVQFGFLRMPQYKNSKAIKPSRIEIPHPIMGHDEIENVEVCLVVKQDSKRWVEEMVEDIYPEYLKCVKLVVGLDDLRTKYGRFKQRRQLMNSYDLFLADDRILPMLKAALGGKFIDRKKFPVPLKLSRTHSKSEALPIAIKKCISSTYMYQPKGTNLTIRAGNTSMKQNELVENFLAIIDGAVKRLPGKWNNILNIAIKTTNSVSLPFYMKRADELAELVGLVKDVNGETSKKRKNSKNDVEHDESISTKSSKSPLLRALKKSKKGDEKETTQQNVVIESKVKTKSTTENDAEAPTQDTTALKKGSSKKLSTSDSATKVDCNLMSAVKKNSSKFKDAKDTILKSDKKADVKKSITKESSNDNSGEGNMTLSDRKSTRKDRKKASSVNESSKVQEKMAKKRKDDIEGVISEPKSKGLTPELSSRKKKKKKSIEEVEEKKEQSDFISSKKFKGAMANYIFQAGPKGTGYYKDQIPVPDKAALEALARLNQQKNRSTPKSGRKGRRNKRR